MSHILASMNLELNSNGSAKEAQCDVCPLSRVQSGVAVRIKQLCATPEVQNRLREIGLGEDQIIKLVTSRNNFICQVCNSRLAISEQLAQLILVEPVLRPIRISPPITR
ncbi:MAG: FeoA family protein [Verrucomicrobiota bacterium]